MYSCNKLILFRNFNWWVDTFVVYAIDRNCGIYQLIKIISAMKPSFFYVGLPAVLEDYV